MLIRTADIGARREGPGSRIGATRRSRDTRRPRRLAPLIALALGAVSVPAAARESSLPPVTPDAKFRHEETVVVAGVPRAELLERARRWADTAFRFAAEVNRMDKPEAGRLAIESRVSLAVSVGVTAFVRHNLAVEVSDGKYRYVLDSSGYSIDALDPEVLKDPKRTSFERADLVKTVAEETRSLIASLKGAMDLTPAGDAGVGD